MECALMEGITNLSVGTEVFPGSLKEVVVWLLLQKTSLDPSDLANYHPVSNLLFLGMVVGRAAAEIAPWSPG